MKIYLRIDNYVKYNKGIYLHIESKVTRFCPLEEIVETLRDSLYTINDPSVYKKLLRINI